MRFGWKLLTVGAALVGAMAVATPAAAVQNETFGRVTDTTVHQDGSTTVLDLGPDYSQSRFASVRAQAPLKEPCDDGYVCIYQHINGEGAVLRTYRGTNRLDLTVYGCICGPSNRWNDQMSSFINRTGIDYMWSTDINREGTWHWMRATHPVNAFNLPQNEQDTASAIFVP